MKQLMQQVCTILNKGEDLVLVTVASQSGSTPRPAGAKMVIRQDGRIHGTIGGGLVEALAMEEAKACFTGRRSLRRAFDLSNNDAAASDMICGGRLELFLEYIPADAANRTVFRDLLAAMNSGRRVILICPFDDDPGGEPRFVIDHQGQSSRADTPEPLLAAIRQVRSSAPGASLIEYQGRRYLLSFFTVAGTVYLLGAGHVSACTAEAAARVGFRVVVMDDRIEFANRERFPWVDEVRVLPSFIGCFQGHEIDGDAYLVIVTRGHMHDMEVLAQALQTGAGYVGMIGSRKKRNAIYAQLKERGVKATQLERVCCPIGTDIEAVTPEEIAVSIVGELIHQRATRRKAWPLA